MIPTPVPIWRNPLQLVLLLGRVAVAGVLLYAGFQKAVAPAAEFAAAMANYHLFPTAILKPLSIAVPYVEMWIGLFLLTGLHTRWAALAAASLFAGFIAVIGITALRGIDLASCGCFGSDLFSPKITLVMDAVLLVLSVLIWKRAGSRPPYSLDHAL